MKVTIIEILKNTIDGLNRLDTPAKWIQDRVKIITQEQNRKTSSWRRVK